MKNSHLTIEERNTILLGIQNDATLTDIGNTIGKDPTTIKKEIMLHREVSYRSALPLECANYKTCQILKKNKSKCNKECTKFVPFYCKRRDKSPGACNGCNYTIHCRFTKYKYNPSSAQQNYQILKVESRQGSNLTPEEAKALADIVKPLLEARHSPYLIVQNNQQIGITERTLYTYIENGALKDFGADAFLLRRQLSRKLPKNKSNQYKKRNDYKYLQGRKHEDYLKFMEENPYAHVVEMDTVYNDITNGPFFQTFRFLDSKLLFAVYHEEKTNESMVKGVDLLEEVLGKELFEKYVQIIKTDRGSEFTDADGLEIRKDGTKRCSLYYCDPMQRCQKPFVERKHVELRYHLPKETDMRKLGLVNQDALNIALSHLNSMSLESLEGKSVFDYASFLYPDLVKKIKEFGILHIEPNSVILNPTLFKK